MNKFLNSYCTKGCFSLLRQTNEYRVTVSKFGRGAKSAIAKIDKVTVSKSDRVSMIDTLLI